jgi:hypothetical protein
VFFSRFVELRAFTSVGSVGDSYDNALAETVIGLYTTEVIRRLGPWRSLGELELTTLEWVDWFNNQRLLEPLGHIPPAEAEAKFFELDDQAPWRPDRPTTAAFEKPGTPQADDKGTLVRTCRLTCSHAPRTCAPMPIQRLIGRRRKNLTGSPIFQSSP